MLLNKIIQRDYTSFSLYYQIKLPLDLEISIPSDDPVRLVSAFVEEMDLSELYKTYGRIRKNQATPRQILKLVIYAAMNRIYSSRDIRKACKRDINFMYLLEGMPAPDHATIARFISLHFSVCAKTLLAQMSDLLYLLGEISGKTIFIDGTKIESAANKYTFVWKKAITKNQARLYTKLSSFVAECEELYGMKTVYHDSISIHTLKRLKKQLCRIKIQEEIVFVHGTGRRKTQLQKSLEQLDRYLEKLKEYTKKLYTLGDRNSYSKTDPDATFMRMKEDAMLNGQLKPAYNIQHGVDSEYITWIDISPRPTDTRTLIPFLKDMESYLGFKYSEIVADAGYESEENYLFIESNGQTAYIKPQNYEISKTRKYKKDISRSESLKTMISLQSLQQQLIDIAPEPSFDRPDNLNNLPEDDFVIVDESAVKIYEFPDCIYIPIGNSRIKMPTSILLTLINLIISTILTISIAVVQFNSSQEDQIKQTQIEETQIELQRAQNEILQQLLHNIDTSSSSEAEAIKELQKTVEEQNKQYSQNQDTCLSVEEDNDNSKLTKDTDTPK